MSLPASFPDSLPISQERLSLLNRFKNERLGKLRPISEFFDRTRISKPNGMGDITQRLSYNLTHFQSNYIIIMLGLLVYCLKLNPDEPFVFQNQVITQKQLYVGLIGFSIPLLFISSAGSAIFWIVGASATLILGHAVFLEPGIEGGFSSPANQV
nr:8340_t:CDS:2 [Entrophospora candida]CAG8567221.1 8672_t:CDS:2 [Entrophospora candida]